MIDWDEYDKESDIEYAKLFDNYMNDTPNTLDHGLEASSIAKAYIIKREVDKDVLKRLIEVASATYPIDQ